MVSHTFQLRISIGGRCFLAPFGTGLANAPPGLTLRQASTNSPNAVAGGADGCLGRCIGPRTAFATSSRSADSVPVGGRGLGCTSPRPVIPSPAPSATRPSAPMSSAVSSIISPSSSVDRTLSSAFALPLPFSLGFPLPTIREVSFPAVTVVPWCWLAAAPVFLPPTLKLTPHLGTLSYPGKQSLIACRNSCHGAGSFWWVSQYAVWMIEAHEAMSVWVGAGSLLVRGGLTKSQVFLSLLMLAGVSDDVSELLDQRC